MGILNSLQDFYNYVFVKNIAKPNLGEDIRLVVNSPEFEKQINVSAPFLLAALLAWPSFWIYRGIVWHSVRDMEPLPLYIKKTFYCSKALELAILMTGIAVTLSSSRKAFIRQQGLKDGSQKK